MTAENWTKLLTSRRAPATWKGLQIFSNPPLAISDITLFAEHCPNLLHLGINIRGRRREVDTDEAQTPASPSSEVDTSPVPSNVRFSDLTSIKFADSELSNAAAVETATLLDELCELCDKLPYFDGWDNKSSATIEILLDQLREKRKGLNAGTI